MYFVKDLGDELMNQTSMSVSLDSTKIDDESLDPKKLIIRIIDPKDLIKNLT